MSTQYGGLPKWNNINFSKNFMNFLACGCLTADVLCFTVFVRKKHCLQLKRRHTNIRAFLKQNWFRNSFTCSLVLLDFVGGGDLLLLLPFPSVAHACSLSDHFSRDEQLFTRNTEENSCYLNSPLPDYLWYQSIIFSARA